MRTAFTKSISLSLALVLGFSFSGCSKTKQTDAEPMKSITIGVMPDLDSIPLVIADKNGYFEKVGVKVKIEQFKSAKDRDSALQSGKLDGVITDVLAVAFANEGGFNLKITSKSDGCYKLVVSPKSKIDSIEGLKNKNVAISSKTLIEYATDEIVKTKGLSDKDFNKVAVPQIPVRLTMLQEGKVDAAVLPEPFASLAIQSGAFELNSTDKMGINPGVIAFTDDALKNKSREIKAIYEAYNLSVQYLQKEPISKFSDVLIKELGFPEGIKDAIVLPKYTKAALPKEKDIDEVIHWMISKELIKKNFKPSELTTDQYVR